ncbi:P-loop containing nucleoside triphosphate hydrolase protein [Absidia repens]|uniref:p-loop containing nucleoside triphosphate hydrolase protein n=1 Tax=Absidia repens TaxID=90262 RepID=A0A1X2ID36_9FUNG|nr:P-loop containing nucleoside triphosphate hydrolase protein [Absidia repens]
MNEDTVPFYSMVTVAGASCVSVAALLLQRKLGSRQNFNDIHRIKPDMEQYFKDNRFPRINLETWALALVVAYQLSLDLLKNTDDHGYDDTMDWIKNALMLCATLYMVILGWISCYYRLPNWWGSILNGHMCLLSALMLCCTFTRFWMEVIWRGPLMNLDLDWITVVPWLAILLLLFDLMVVTVTVPYDRLYLDDTGSPNRQQENPKMLPTHSSSILGTYLYNYIDSLINTTSEFRDRKQVLPENKLPGLPPQITSLTALQKMNQLRSHTAWSLMYKLFVANRRLVLLQVFWSLLFSTTFYLPPVLLKQLLLVLEDLTKMDKDENHNRYVQLYVQAILWILAQVFTTIYQEVVIGRLWYYAHVLEIAIRSILNVEIFRKTLLRPNHTTGTGPLNADDDESDEEDKSRTTATVGNVINLMSTDAQSFSNFISYAGFFLWGTAIELFIGLFILYGLLGNSSLVGVLVMILSIPVTHVTSKKLSDSLDDIMAARDRRGSVMHEVLRGIRQIKFFAWESQWKARLLQLRNHELNHLFVIYCCELILMTIWQGLPLLVIIASFWSFTMLENKELTPPIAFTAMFIYSQLRIQLTTIPESIVKLLQALVSLRRIEDYLSSEDLTEKEPLATSSLETTDPTVIGFTNASITWAESSTGKTTGSTNTTNSGNQSDQTVSTFKLTNINATFPANELSLICGKTGSGKTLLILALLGEAPCTEGSVSFPRAPLGMDLDDFTYSAASMMVAPDSDDDSNDKWLLKNQVAYVAQTAWLQNATIRDNILFGLPYIKDRYDSTLWACSLLSDLNILIDGDMTEIGERGINLSGGQRARVSLARAVYSRSQIILLDDVLSAVDAHTAKHLYDNCLTGPLMQNRTRILVTHHVNLCYPKCSYLMHLQNGQIDICGTPEALNQEGVLSALVDEKGSSDEDIKVVGESSAYRQAEEESSTQAFEPHVLVETEFRAQGLVKQHLYLIYLRAVGGPFFWFVLATLIIGMESSQMVATWWIKQWSSAYDKIAGANGTSELVINNHSLSSGLSSFSDDNKMPAKQVEYYLGVYVIISLTYIAVSTSGYAMSYMGGMRASRKLYATLLDRVLHAPLRFFDTTPVGRILNRFAGDMESIDSGLPIENMDFARSGLTMVAILVSAVIVAPWFLLPALLIACGTVYYTAKFTIASQDSKRLESVSKSPLYSHFTETTVGITTIRAYGATKSFLQTMLWYNDDFSRPSFLTDMVNRWVSIRFAYLGCLLNLFCGFLILFNLDRQKDASLAGFVFSYALTFADESFWAAYHYRRVQMSYSSVERLVELMDVDQESTTGSAEAPSDWPHDGTIKVQDLEVRYAPELDMALKGVSFSVRSGEKIGVVGKTGSGKSTLTLALFRFLEAAKGKITIDGIDISTMDLDVLRSRLTIIPQDAILFSGSVRTNMDPFGEFSDAAIEEALRRVHLVRPPETTPVNSSSSSLASDADEPANRNIFECLDSPITEGGHNLSIGQRQLVCLARALLKQTKVVIMDEATSSVDFETDRAIQQTMATEFASCTIMCVAHRLNSVINYDRILVIEDGQVKEYDSPAALISNPRSRFYKMCVDSGEFTQLQSAVGSLLT